MKNADLFKDTFGTYATEIWSMPENDFLKWLNEDAKPKTGHWIAEENEEMETIGYYCSECDLPMETKEKTRFCPNCGAKMVEDCSNLDSCENCKYDDGECCRLIYEAKMESEE